MWHTPKDCRSADLLGSKWNAASISTTYTSSSRVQLYKCWSVFIYIQNLYKKVSLNHREGEGLCIVVYINSGGFQVAFHGLGKASVVNFVNSYWP